MRTAPFGLGCVAALLLFTSSPALAHDVSADVTGSLTTSSSTNPRVGSLGANAAFTYDFSDAVSAWLGLSYFRDLPTRTAQTSSPGSNVFLVNAGGLFVPSEHWTVLSLLSVSPPAEQLSATSLFVPRLNRSADVVLRSTTNTQALTLVGGYATNGESSFEHGFDATLGVARFGTLQVLDERTAGFAAVSSLCAAAERLSFCPLVRGVPSELWQVKVGGGYTLTIKERFDAALEVLGSLYSKDPTSVGYFSVVIAGRTGPELGTGVPVAPYALTVRPSVSYRFEKVTLRGSYQAGVYVQGLGVNHQLTARVSVKVHRQVKLVGSLTGQVDGVGQALESWGLSSSVGVLVSF